MFPKSIFIILILLFSLVCRVRAQRIIHGHIYGGMSKASPVDSVRLQTSSGNSVYTDRHGEYSILTRTEKDTLLIFYQEHQTARFTVTPNTVPDTFDVYLNNPAFFNDNLHMHELADVKVHTRNYHDDSLQTRKDYADIFDYKKPTFKYGKDWVIIPPIFGSVDIDNLIRLAQINRTKKKWRDKQFALSSESELYVNSRFTRSLAGSITHLDDDDALAAFMDFARPTSEQLQGMNDLELNQYIFDQFKEYKNCKVSEK